MIQRFARDESGMTMGLAMIMILLISVMGAGLLTFANTNLNTVVEANRGQRAFEVADAGVEAARRQLTDDCIGNSTCRTHYDGGDDDIQWSLENGGLILNDLDGDGNVTTSDNVTVTIEYREFIDTANDFKVISTGTYGDSKRKIEAIFKPIAAGGGGGGNVINPAYYTPSDIKLQAGTTAAEKINIKGLSLFSGKNIIIESPTPLLTPTDFKTEYEKNNNQFVFTHQKGNAVLGDWNTTLFDPFPGTWNTVGRIDYKDKALEDPGFGAEGMICSSTTSCSVPSDSIAEGRYGYDSTTGPINGLTGASQTPKGQGLTFVSKEPLVDGTYPPNTEGTITYPFERKAPDVARLKQLAIDSNTWYRGSNPDWDTLLGDRDKRVVFIDAGDNPEPLTLDGGGGSEKGIIVVWCGTLNMTNFNSSGFQGIVMALNSDNHPEFADMPPDPETGAASSSCPGSEQGKFSIDHAGLKAWFYAEGGDVSAPGIVLGPGTQADFLPGGSWKLLDLIFEDAVPTSIELQGWRELYQ